MVYQFRKKPGEDYPYSHTFSKADGTAYAGISSHTVVATDSAGNDVTATVIQGTAASGNTVQIWVQAGTSGQRYRIRTEAVMTTGEDLIEDAIMDVRD